MNDLDARIAACLGWTKIQKSINRQSSFVGIDPSGAMCYLTAYSADLNEMHALEEALTDEEWVDYITSLVIATKATFSTEFSKRMVHANAEQRAEAWLKVKEVKG
jgi:hypothetical protein